MEVHKLRSGDLLIFFDLIKTDEEEANESDISLNERSRENVMEINLDKVTTILCGCETCLTYRHRANSTHTPSVSSGKIG